MNFVQKDLIQIKMNLNFFLPDFTEIEKFEQLNSHDCLLPPMGFDLEKEFMRIEYEIIRFNVEKLFEMYGK